ncbi:MAG: translocation/assembly module TamB domain-containing protein, partial [Lentimicrobiaceae bacterium]|nr:translocation/assembly module TamB domain-containing protein [Lentimicrobiaceae bacterium]
PKLHISPKTSINGHFNCSDNTIDIKTKTDLIQYANISVFDANIDINNHNIADNIDANITAKAIVPSKTNRIDTTFYIFENFDTKINIVDNKIQYNILWDNIDYSADDGNIVGHIDLQQFPKTEIINSKSHITYHDSTWQLFPNSKIVIDSNAILVDNFGILHNKQKLSLNGVLSSDIKDELLVNISNFDVSIADFLTLEKNMDFDGIITGSAKVASVLGSPRLDADFYLDKFGFNGERLGSAKILSIWDNVNSELNLDVQVVYKGNYSTYYPIKVLGKVMPYNKGDNFGLDIEMDNFNISTLEPFTEGIFSRIRGLALGKLKLSGTFSEPVLLGNLNLMRSEFLVDFLKTSYSFTGNINLAEDRIWFKDITLTDSIGKTGIASGSIYHKNFSDLTTDIKIVAKNLSALNTEYSPNQIFYGKAIVSGIVDITGPFNNLDMDIKIRTEQGTNVVIPLNSSTSINDNDFIIFRNSEESDSITFDHFIKEKGGLNVSLGIEANPNAKLGIVLPNQLGDIEVIGEGNIALDVNTKGGYAMHGEYVMEKGVFNFNFQNILKRTFSISSGSSITFNGSPFDANVDISAVYKLRTSVNTLPGMSEYGDVRVPVNCVLKMKNNLFNPDLTFSIDLPDVDNEIRQKIFSVIDTSSVTAMNQQMISLLVLNSFSSNSGVMLAETGILSSTELFTNQINNWLSQISKDFDIGVKYRPGSDISTQDLELVLSTQLFDNRVTINGSFGSSYSASTQSNRWIGDMEVEVKITQDGRLRTKVFNRTNTALSYITEQSPYTQGVGIYYRREFDIIKEFFKNKSPNVRNK